MANASPITTSSWRTSTSRQLYFEGAPDWLRVQTGSNEATASCRARLSSVDRPKVSFAQQLFECLLDLTILDRLLQRLVDGLGLGGGPIDPLLSGLLCLLLHFGLSIRF